ncbi:hypothetical protein SAMN05421819_3232 [Bryocella elongata]|uniref:Uncharacterized protein n=1 Tax=Bryocella elongata TaxID=863522 RepID=A0A1H6ALC8_9BACT|nr:hypothetical protein SAMN05421819_3232 [Bryocella elongata]
MTVPRDDCLMETQRTAVEVGTTRPFTRRDILRSLSAVAGSFALPGWSPVPHVASGASIHCTPAPTFPVPLTVGTWRSEAFPVGKHDYHVWLNVDRRLPLDQLDCDLGPPRPNHRCDTPPLLHVEWKVWDGDAPVRSYSANPPKAAGWGADATSCFLGDFEGKWKGMFTLEWNVLQDGGRLKDLHPRIEIVKNPGYWCWL